MAMLLLKQVLAMFVIAGMIICDKKMKMAYSQCQGDMPGLIEQCSRYVQKQGPKVDPSQGCCAVVKTVDFPCVCHHITREVQGIISMEKAAYVAQSCGKPLAHGTKCGSYTVP